MIEPLALNEYIENGWVLGKHISKIIVTNGDKNIFINPIDEEFYNKRGYFRSRTIKKDIKHRDKKAIVSTNLSNDDLWYIF